MVARARRSPRLPSWPSSSRIATKRSPTVKLSCIPLDVGGDQACIEWVATATHSGPIAFDDEVLFEPTGKRVTLRGVTIADFTGNRIHAFRQYWDEVALLEQLDLLPTD